MTDIESISRRSAIIGACACGVVGLAACSSGADDGGSAGDSGASESSPEGTVEYKDGIPLSEIPIGSGVITKIDGKDVVITAAAAGEIHAFTAICTHQQCVVGVKQDAIACPCHGSQYDLITGEPTQGPATKPLEEYVATISDDIVTVEVT